MIKNMRLLFCICLAAAFKPAGAVNACQQLVGTWSATYTIISEFTDKFTIQSVNGATVKGVTEFGVPMHGFCKKGVLFVTEDYSDYYVDGYYFTKTFGRALGTYEADYAHRASWNRATIVKTSNNATVDPKVAPAYDADRRVLKASEAAQLNK